MFQAHLFRNLDDYTESPLVDWKSQLYDLSNDKSKAEFIRDVISFANSSRLFGKEARILFGIDNTSAQVSGIGDSLKYYDQSGKSLIHAQEKVLQQFKNIIFEYIEPICSWELKVGNVDGFDVAYLLIHPHSTARPFHVKKMLRVNGNLALQPNDTWIRFGESKQKVELKALIPKDKLYSYCYGEGSYLLPKNWKNHLEALRNKVEIIKADQIKNVQPLFSSNNQLVDEEIMACFRDDMRLIILEGAAGTGKTVLLRRLVKSLADGAIEALNGQIGREEFQTPPTTIPLYCSLRGKKFNDESSSLLNELLKEVHCLEVFRKTISFRLESIFENQRIQWLICLDGLDELASNAASKRFFSELRSFRKWYPHVNVILTTRPSAVQSNWGEWDKCRLIHIAPLRDDAVSDYLVASLLEDRALIQAEALLHSNEQLRVLCAYPVCLEMFVQSVGSEAVQRLEENVVVNVEVSPLSISTISSEDERLPKAVSLDTLLLDEPNSTEPEFQAIDENNHESEYILPLGVILSRMYENLWNREQLRHEGIDADRLAKWKDATGDLALRSDGKHQKFDRSFIKQSLKSDNPRRWLLNLGILYQPDQQLYSFHTELTKLYFAAAYIQPQLKTDSAKQVRKLTIELQGEFCLKLQEILSQITTDDFEFLFKETNQE